MYMSSMEVTWPAVEELLEKVRATVSEKSK